MNEKEQKVVHPNFSGSRKMPTFKKRSLYELYL